MPDPDGRPLPHDLDAEAGVLGAALLDPRAVPLVTAIPAGDWYRPAHRHIAEAIAALVERGDPVDPVTVAGEIRRTGPIERIGGPGALTDLLHAAPVLAHAATYAETVARTAAARRIFRIARDVEDRALAGGDPAALAVDARALFDELPATDGSTVAWADVAAILAGDLEVTVSADYLTRTDGAGLLYAGRTHFLWGEPSSGKGWIALTACRQVLDAGGAVVYIDLEDTDAGIVGRLVALGASPADLARFHLARPRGPLGPAELADIEARALAANPELLVIDGIAEALMADDVEEQDNIEVTRWLRRVPRRLAETTGAAVVMVDHVAKSREDRGRWGRGAGAKLAAIDGIAYVVEVRDPFSRNVAGLVDLRVSKDRHGAVGPVGAVAAHFHIEPQGGGAVVRTRLEPPSADEAEGKPTKAMTHISGVVAANPGLSRAQLVKSHRAGYGEPIVNRAIDVLIGAGHLHAERKGRSVVLTSLRPYPDPGGEAATLLTDEPYEEF